MGGGIQTTIDTYPDIKWLHAPPYVEERMAKYRSRRRLGDFGRRMTPHAPSERRVRVEIDGALVDAPTVIRREKEKKMDNYRIAPHTLCVILSFCRAKTVIVLFKQILKTK